MEELDPNILKHHKINWEKAYKYAKMIEKGDVFPPIIVDRIPNGVLRVFDGAHRTAAHKMLGIKIQAIVR